MSKYKKLATSKTLVSSIGNIEIVKFQKVGTCRVFWTPVYNGTRITRTLFGRMWEAESFSRKFVEWKLKQAS